MLHDLIERAEKGLTIVEDNGSIDATIAQIRFAIDVLGVDNNELCDMLGLDTSVKNTAKKVLNSLDI